MPNSLKKLFCGDDVESSSPETQHFIGGLVVGGAIMTAMTGTAWIVSERMQRGNRDVKLYEYLDAQGKRLRSEHTDVRASNSRYSSDPEANADALSEAEKRMALVELLIAEYNDRIELLYPEGKLRDGKPRPPLHPISSVHDTSKVIEFGTGPDGKPLEFEARGEVQIIPGRKP